MVDEEDIKHKYKKNGTTLFDLKKSFFSEDDFQKLEELSKKLPYEFIETGDAGEPNSVEVGRFMTDVEEPKIVNESISRKAVSILNKKEYVNFYERIIGKDKLFIRRAQVNKMRKNQFVGYHLDVDSNPDYLAAVVIQFASDFTGGDYVVYKNGENKEKKNIRYAPKFQTMTISNCEYPHEVSRVESGTRISLVFFLCSHYGKNRRAS